MLIITYIDYCNYYNDNKTDFMLVTSKRTRHLHNLPTSIAISNVLLGPILFTMYIKPLSAIIDSHSIIDHSFADDLQLEMSAPQREYLSYFTLCSHV